jgi:hypothetical protein
MRSGSRASGGAPMVVDQNATWRAFAGGKGISRQICSAGGQLAGLRAMR